MGLAWSRMRRVVALAVVALGFVSLVVPRTALADHCPGAYAKVALSEADRIVLAELTDEQHSDKDLFAARYRFKTERTYLWARCSLCSGRLGSR